MPVGLFIAITIKPLDSGNSSEQLQGGTTGAGYISILLCIAVAGKPLSPAKKPELAGCVSSLMRRDYFRLRFQ